MKQTGPIARTVRGDIPTAAMGHTQPHEHLLVDLRDPAWPTYNEDQLAEEMAPITLANYYQTRREHRLQDLLLDNEDVARRALTDYHAAGGSTIVEATSKGLGRQPEALRRLASATGVNVIMGSGYYYVDYQPLELASASMEQISEEMIRDISEGVATTGVRAGFIGEVGLSWPHHDVEMRVLTAAGHAQRATGTALMVHPGRDERSPLRAVGHAVAAGADPTRIIMSHVDRTLFTIDDIRMLADTGCYLAFDLFGQEMSYYSLAQIDMPNDAQRIQLIRSLIDSGHGRQILISQDVCHKTNLKEFGGEGYTHILDHVIPMMRLKNFTREEVAMLCVHNPARAFRFDSDY